MDEALRMAEARRWMSRMPRPDFELFLLLCREQYDQGVRDCSEQAAKFAGWAHMVPPDGGSPTEEESNLAASIASDIRAGLHLLPTGAVP